MSDNLTVNFDMPVRDTKEINIVCCPHEWVSIKDKLPEINNGCAKDVIILLKGMKQSQHGCYSMEYGFFLFGGFSCSFNHEDLIKINEHFEVGHQNVYYIPSHDITHWMYLPDVPKDKE